MKMTVDCAGMVKTWFLKLIINRTQTTVNFYCFFCFPWEFELVVLHCTSTSQNNSNVCKDILKLHAIYSFQIPLLLGALSQELGLSKLLIIDCQWTQSAP